MPEETTENTESIESESQEQDEISNSQWKSHPLTSKLTKELADLRRAEEARKDEAEKAAREASLRQAEEDGRLKEEIAKLQSSIEATKAQYSQELLKRDLTYGLMRAGITNEMFINGAIQGYSGDAGTIEEYVSSIIDNDANKAFLPSQDGQSTPTPPKPPGKAPSSGGNVSWAQVNTDTKSSDPEVREKARAAILDYYKRTGEMPPA